MSVPRSYQATRSRDPIWTQVTCDPEDGLRTTIKTNESLRQSVSSAREASSNAGSTTNIPGDETSVLIEGERRGLNRYSAAIFIAGEMAGSGILALPRAIVDTGYIGILVLLFFAMCAGYGGYRLGTCWSILEERYPEHRSRTRNPYAMIALRACGKKFSFGISLCIRVTLFGASIVYLLLCSQIMHELFNSFYPRSPCFWFWVVAMCLVFPMWAGSPKDFLVVGFGALVTTGVACILYFAQMAMDAYNATEPALHTTHGFNDFFLSFGTLLFAFGGASTFPTIQNDMQKKTQFSWSIFVAFIIIMVLYFPITVGGYFIYGENVSPNIAMTVTQSGLVYIADILMAIHLLFAFLIVVNPVCQELEEALNVPRNFCWKRAMLRTLMVVVMVIIGEGVPQFGKLISLVGGSTITFLTFVFPCYFYIKLCDQENPHWPERKIPLHERVFIWELILIGVMGGIAATISATHSIFNSDFGESCYSH